MPPNLRLTTSVMVDLFIIFALTYSVRYPRYPALVIVSGTTSNNFNSPLPSGSLGLHDYHGLNDGEGYCGALMP